MRQQCDWSMWLFRAPQRKTKSDKKYFHKGEGEEKKSRKGRQTWGPLHRDQERVDLIAVKPLLYVCLKNAKKDCFIELD